MYWCQIWTGCALRACVWACCNITLSADKSREFRWGVTHARAHTPVWQSISVAKKERERALQTHAKVWHPFPNICDAFHPKNNSAERWDSKAPFVCHVGAHRGSGQRLEVL